MTIWWLALILAAIGSVGIAFVWLAARIGSTGAGKPVKNVTDSIKESAEQDVERIFNDNFREELRSRGWRERHPTVVSLVNIGHDASSVHVHCTIAFFDAKCGRS